MPDTEIGNQTKLKSFWTEIHFNQQHMCLLTVNNNNYESIHKLLILLLFIDFFILDLLCINNLEKDKCEK